MLFHSTAGRPFQPKVLDDKYPSSKIFSFTKEFKAIRAEHRAGQQYLETVSDRCEKYNNRRQKRKKMRIEMKPTELGELYALLSMYGQVYGGIGEELLLEVADKYDKAMTGRGCDKGNKGAKMSPNNPRGAGRKPREIEGEIEKILELRREGMTIREIALQAGCSTGRVHKLINERS